VPVTFSAIKKGGRKTYSSDKFSLHTLPVRDWTSVTSAISCFVMARMLMILPIDTKIKSLTV
jgi:hypothetical protein